MNQPNRDFTKKDVAAIRHHTCFDGFMRALWWERLDPSRDPSRFRHRFFKVWEHCFVSEAHRLFGEEAPRKFNGRYGLPLVPKELWSADWFCQIHSYVSFDELLNDLHIDSDHPWYESWKHRIGAYRDQVSILSPEMIGSLRTISHEYMLWIRKHPELLPKIAWEAFEQIVGEIFASKGFTVELTRRVRNATCDVFAVRADEFGAETRYLIECKKYVDSRRVALSVVNQVIGAAKRRNIDHAFLVTTSSFTREVLSQKAAFHDLRLHLRDGIEIAKWLRDYKPRDDAGLWLNENWQELI